MFKNYLTIYKKEILSFSISFIGATIGLFCDIIFARLLTANDYGIFRYFYTFVLIFSLLLSFGASQLLIKNFAENISSNKKIKAFYYQIIISTFLLILFIILFSFFYKDNYSIKIVLSTYFFIFIYLWIYLRIFFIALRAITIGIGNYIEAQISDRFLINLLLIFLIFIFYILNLKIDLFNIFLLNLLVLSISIIFLFSSINKKKLNFFKIKLSTLNYTGMVSRVNTSKYTSGTEILELFIRQGIILVMALSYTFTEIAILAVLLRVSDTVFLISASLMSIYSNKISSNNHKIRSSVIKKINNFNFISMIFALIFFFIFGYYILNLFGEIYSTYQWSLFIIVFSIFLKLLFGPSSFILNVHGESKINFKINFFTSIITLISLGYFSKFLSIQEILFIYVLLNVLNNIILSFVCYKKLNIRADIFNFYNAK